MAAEEPRDLDKELPYELVPGVYANLLDVWSTVSEFTLDFGVYEPHAGEPFRVVSRIRVPVTLIFTMLQWINEELTAYERRFGSVEYLSRPVEDG